uniref:(northern house mosquito) hypothetical protein n=1 Tax=Culex pipiens TaxID=7175 RepID=A0A8D8BK60_CULPI
MCCPTEWRTSAARRSFCRKVNANGRLSSRRLSTRTRTAKPIGENSWRTWIPVILGMPSRKHRHCSVWRTRTPIDCLPCQRLSQNRQFLSHQRWSTQRKVFTMSSKQHQQEIGM